MHLLAFTASLSDLWPNSSSLVNHRCRNVHRIPALPTLGGRQNKAVENLWLATLSSMLSSPRRKSSLSTTKSKRTLLKNKVKKQFSVGHQAVLWSWSRNTAPMVGPFLWIKLAGKIQGCGFAFIFCGSGPRCFSQCGSGSWPNLTKFAKNYLINCWKRPERFLIS